MPPPQPAATSRRAGPRRGRRRPGSGSADPALLLLDNCEQALDAVDADEAVHILGPLPLSPSGSLPSPAVTLFVQRARLRPTELTPTELDVIARICRAVDGIPLAIELAAALVTTYSLGEIADLVDLDPGGLAAIGRGQARHHQTLSSAIDRSYRLLSPQEQLTYRRLSVLSPGFARGLAAAVVQPEIERGSVPDLLARLVHRSLLTVSHAAGDQARFHQLAPIRAHAARILARAEETDTGERLRDEWTRDLVRHRPRAGRPTERDWYRSVTDNLSTIRATLQRRLSINAAALAGRDPDIGLPWSRRLLDLQEQLAGHTSPHQLETLADFLALDGQYASAVRVFSSSHHRARRAGITFPRNRVSTELVALCRTNVPIREFDHAWAVGPALSLPELTAR